MASRVGSDRPHEQARLVARPAGASATAKPPHPGVHTLGFGQGRDGALLVPPELAPGTAIPLVVALHGAGGVMAQMLGLMGSVAQSRNVALLVPESRASTWDLIGGGYGPDVAFIDRALGAAFERMAIDPGRIAIAGFSDGASYALSLGVANGNLFSDILAFSPGFMSGPDQEGSPRLFISHGRSDQVLPIERCSRRLAPALERAGYDLEYREFDGGHVVPTAMIERAFARFLD